MPGRKKKKKQQLREGRRANAAVTGEDAKAVIARKRNWRAGIHKGGGRVKEERERQRERIMQRSVHLL